MSNLQVLAVPVAFLLGCLVGVTGLAVLVIVELIRTGIEDFRPKNVVAFIRRTGPPGTKAIELRGDHR